MDIKTLKLLAGKEFNEILAGDAVLKELEAAKYNPEQEKRLLLEVLQLGDYRVGNLPVRPLTIAKWSFLWMLKSPFVVGGTAEIHDWDIFLYVLSQIDLQEISCSIDEISAKADGYALATQLDAKNLLEEVRSMIKSAFLPFEMLPPKTSGNTAENGIYDGMWASFMAGIAARESGMDFNYCLHKMSLSCVCTLWVNWQRRESIDGDKIRRRTPPEIEQQISERFDILAKEYIAKVQQE